jgi:hypothetical protein
MMSLLPLCYSVAWISRYGNLLQINAWHRVWVMVECRGSRVICWGPRVEVEGQKSRSRVKSRGSKFKGRN